MSSIDLDADPFVPEGWTVEEHRKGGRWHFDPKQVELFLADGQKDDRYIAGTELRKELANKPVFNANLLDYLLANPDLIPEEWKKDGQGNTRYIVFWGTLYRNRHRTGSLCARYLYYGGTWHWSHSWADRSWSRLSPAAVRAR